MSSFANDLSVNSKSASSPRGDIALAIRVIRSLKAPVGYLSEYVPPAHPLAGQFCSHVGTIKPYLEAGAYCFMPNKTFLVRLRSNSDQHVRATTVEVHGNHLVFLTEKGKLAAAFLLDLVESWNEIAS
jgi:hypothetical protein